MFKVFWAATILLSNFVCFICSADIKNGVGGSSATMIVQPPMGYMKMEDFPPKTGMADILDEMAKPQMDGSQSAQVRVSAYSTPDMMYPSLRPLVPTGLSPAMKGFAAYVGQMNPIPMMQPTPQPPLSFGLPAAMNTHAMGNMPMPSVPVGFGKQMPDVAGSFSFSNHISGPTTDIISNMEIICLQVGAVIRQIRETGLDSFLKYSQTLQDITQCLARSCSLLQSHDFRSQMMSQIKRQVISAIGSTLVHGVSGENQLSNTYNITDGSADSSD